jgi:ABC-type transport system involved in multi-copper enzyme maturation permease subunit
MLGPVFHQEMLLGGRRGRIHVFRWLYAGWLLILALGILYFVLLQGIVWRRGPANFLDLGDGARLFLSFAVPQHFLLLALATPVLVAGAITDEKSRGTLQYLLTADLLPGEIILGKLLGRCWQVFVLLLPGLPLVCFLGAFAGIDLGGLVALALASSVFLFAVAAAALLASVWSRHTRDAVLGLLVVGVVGGIGLHLLRSVLESRDILPWLRDLLHDSGPLHPMGQAWLLAEPGQRWGLLMPYLLVWAGVGGVCLAVAVWRLPGAYLRQLENVGRKRARWWHARRPAPAGDPVRWKERHVEGIAPLAWLRRLPRWPGLTLVFLATVLASGHILLDRLPYGVTPARVWEMARGLDLEGLAGVVAELSPSSSAFQWQGMVVLFAASLVIAVRCSGAITGERERQTWEALLLTPLETRQLVRSKLWGIVGASFPYLIAYAVPALALAAVGGLGSLFIVALFLALTWLALYYVGAAGLWCSASSRSSWRSLLGTLAFTYGGGLILLVIVWTVAGFLLIILFLLLMVLEFFLQSVGLDLGLVGTRLTGFGSIMQVVVCAVLAGAFLLLALYLTWDAEKWIAARERTRHWKEDEPRPRRSRRRRR